MYHGPRGVPRPWGVPWPSRGVPWPLYEEYALEPRNYLYSCPHNMVNFGPLAAEIVSLVWGTPANFNGFRVLAVLLHGSLFGRQPNFAALNRESHLYSAGRPSRWALAHILVYYGDTAVCTIAHRAEKIQCVSKSVTTSSCCNFDTHESILIIFGRSVTELVSNQKVRYFLNAPK